MAERKGAEIDQLTLLSLADNMLIYDSMKKIEERIIELIRRYGKRP